MKHALACALLIATPALAQDEANDGELAYNNHCRTCHSTDEGDNRLGPHLHDLSGREAGSVEGYGYSSSLAESDVVWNAETLDAFIENPDAVVRGNNMKPYSGLTEPDLRAAIVSYLIGEE